MMFTPAANITTLFDRLAARGKLFLPIRNDTVTNFDEYTADAEAESLGPLTAFDLANDKEVAL